MILLAIDTSTDFLSLAVMRDGNTLAKFHEKTDRRHSILLVPMIDKLLKKARLKLKQVDCFVISIGPGSFTGLRIGVTVVKGLAFSLKKPVITVPTLDIIAYNARGFKGVVCPVLDARKKKVYASLYRSDGESVKKISRYLLLPLDELLKKTAKYDKVLFLGDTKENSFKKDWHPRAEVAAILAKDDIKKKRFVKPEDLEPMYLYSRECDVTGK